MAHYSDTSDGEDFEEILSHVIPEEEIIGASWAAERITEETKPHKEESGDAVKMTSRAYQLEMLEASLKENVIVAMDTGSGKTQV
jgi:superfamily II DNA or RNA helicase